MSSLIVASICEKCFCPVYRSVKTTFKNVNFYAEIFWCYMQKFNNPPTDILLFLWNYVLINMKSIKLRRKKMEQIEIWYEKKKWVRQNAYFYFRCMRPPNGIYNRLPLIKCIYLTSNCQILPFLWLFMSWLQSNLCEFWFY